MTKQKAKEFKQDFHDLNNQIGAICNIVYDYYDIKEYLKEEKKKIEDPNAMMLASEFNKGQLTLINKILNEFMVEY